jgi:hypothetical protein
LIELRSLNESGSRGRDLCGTVFRKRLISGLKLLNDGLGRDAFARPKHGAGNIHRAERIVLRIWFIGTKSDKSPNYLIGWNSSRKLGHYPRPIVLRSGAAFRLLTHIEAAAMSLG